MKSKNYIVCSTVRSGSTLLCNTLGRLEGCGQPQEYFHRHIIRRLKLHKNSNTFLSYCRAICREGLTHHGAFGIKMHWWQFLDFLNLSRNLPELKEKQDLEILNTLFPDMKFIYLWRQDITAQAISAAIAAQTGDWEKPDKADIQSLSIQPKAAQKSAITSPKFQPWKIYEWEQDLQRQNQRWRQFFEENNLSYYEITYETLISSFAHEIANILDYIGIGKHPATNELAIHKRQQSRTLNRQFIQYYTLVPKPVSATLYWLYRQVKSRWDRGN